MQGVRSKTNNKQTKKYLSWFGNKVKSKSLKQSCKDMFILTKLSIVYWEYPIRFQTHLDRRVLATDYEVSSHQVKREFASQNCCVISVLQLRFWMHVACYYNGFLRKAWRTATLSLCAPKWRCLGHWISILRVFFKCNPKILIFRFVCLALFVYWCESPTFGYKESVQFKWKDGIASETNPPLVLRFLQILPCM